ncbi:MAG: hypothetical protein IKW84_06615 [Bacteroidaceae bacterium]|nr:hypothetical protein [Bacteroidaceae bacterium]
MSACQLASVRASAPKKFYDFYSQECLNSYIKAKRLCAKLQTMTVFDPDQFPVL